MKNHFKSDVVAKGFFKTYLLFYVPIVVVSVIASRTSEYLPALSGVLSAVQWYLTVLLGFMFFRFIIQAVSYRDTAFSFSGMLGEFAVKVLKWTFFTAITLGIYMPWYHKNMLQYYLSHTHNNGKNGDFLSKPTTLLKYMLFIVLIFIVLAVLAAVLMFGVGGLAFSSDAYDAHSANLVLRGAPAVLLFLLSMLPFAHLYIMWLINVKFGNYTIRLNRRMGETVGIVLSQVLLTIITAGIYYPAAYIRIYRYIASGSTLSDASGNKVGNLGFEGSVGKGFLLSWGQALLSIITLGLYIPFAVAKLVNWYMNHTYVEGDVEL